MKTIFFFTLIFLLTNASLQISYWSRSATCSGTAYYTDQYYGKCISPYPNTFVILSQDLFTSVYHLYYYGDFLCLGLTNTITFPQNYQVGACFTVQNTSYNIQNYFCFPGDSQMMLPSQEKVPLSEIKVGQSVAAYEGNDVMFSEVYTFLYDQKDIYYNFREIHYLEEDGKEGKIALSDEHLILAKRTGDSKYVQAKDVMVGDYIFKSYHGMIAPVIVNAVTFGSYKGAFAPATMAGTLIVDDIVVSSYAIVSHDVAHAMMSPLRLGYKMSPSLISSDFSGLHPYGKTLYDMFPNWVNHPHHSYAAHTLDS